MAKRSTGDIGPKSGSTSISINQLKAARALLAWSQYDLSEAAGVGVATVRRVEGGTEIGNLHFDAILRALESAGVVFIGRDASVDGERVEEGVAKVRLQVGSRAVR